ncbi:uncharacterized protein LOC143904485 [Temnothorax americanus]|uniref:uncharacterized protein LOC143904485 n=1 Tax=Temnothorax americanus TaxID=1964332 RepID=UPI0040697772
MDGTYCLHAYTFHVRHTRFRPLTRPYSRIVFMKLACEIQCFSNRKSHTNIIKAGSRIRSQDSSGFQIESSQNASNARKIISTHSIMLNINEHINITNFTCFIRNSV